MDPWSSAMTSVASFRDWSKNTTHQIGGFSLTLYGEVWKLSFSIMETSNLPFQLSTLYT
jgi:hypothetical protein